MSGLGLLLLVTVVLLAGNAFFVLAEFASVRSRRTRIEQLADEGDAAAGRLLPVLTTPAALDRYVATCQVGITLTTLALGFYSQDALAPRLEEWLGGALGATTAAAMGTLAALLLMTTLQIVFGELVPKAVAVRYPERSALAASSPMAATVRLLAPFVAFLNGSAIILLRLLRQPQPTGHSHVHSPEEIELLVAESGSGGVLDPIERQMLHNAFDLTQLVARQVMIPRNRLELADVDTPVPLLLKRLATSPFSRIPVYRNDQDHVLGIVHLKDLYRLHMAGQGTVADAVRPVPFVPEMMPVADLWQVLHQRQNYLAVVIDEYGGTAGIITQEDLLEEIIGEVQDEFDAETAPIEPMADGRVRVRGDVVVEHVNSSLGLDLPTTQADTMGGLVVDLLGRLAEPGDVVRIGGTRCEVLSVRGRSVGHVAIEVPALTPPARAKHG